MHGGLGNVGMHVWHVHECVMPAWSRAAPTYMQHACHLSGVTERLHHTYMQHAIDCYSIRCLDEPTACILRTFRCLRFLIGRRC